MLVLSIYEAKTGALDRTTLPRVPVVLTPWIVVALVHCAIWPLVGVPTFDTLPPPLPPEAFSVPDVIDKLVPRARLPKVVVPEA